MWRRSAPGNWGWRPSWSKATNALAIRFRPNQPFVSVDDCPLPLSTTTWSLWSHLWRPTEPGRYQIVLRVNDRTAKYAKAYPPGVPMNDDVQAELRELQERQGQITDVTQKIARGDNQ